MPTTSDRYTRDLTLVEFTDPNSGSTYNQVIPTQIFSVTDAPAIRSRNTESFVGFDVRSELAYQLTRYITIRAGVQMIDIASGVWRGGDGSQGTNNLPAGSQNQDLVMLGGSLGVTLNR